MTYKWIAASSWLASDDVFSVRVDLNELLEEHGDGIYSILIWNKNQVISQLAFFRGVARPHAYNPSNWP